MIASASHLRTHVDALRVLIRNGGPNAIARAEGLVKEVVKREPALKGKTDVLEVLREGIEPERNVASSTNLSMAEALLGLIAKMLHEFQPSQQLGRVHRPNRGSREA